MSRLSGHFVYIVQCADGTLYTGYARDPRKREQAHNKGRGARYTSGRRPVVLVYAERCRSVGDALRREREVKRWSRARKALLISGHPPSTRQDRSRPDARDTRQKMARIKASALAEMLNRRGLEIRS